MLFILFHWFDFPWDFVQLKRSGYLSAVHTFPLAWFPLEFCSAEEVWILKCCSYFSIGLVFLGILFSRRGLDT